MIMLCQEIKEVKVEGKKYFVSRLVLDEKFPQNSGHKVAVLEFASYNRPKDLEPGEYYTIKRIPFITAVPKTENGKTSKKIENRIKKELESEEVV